MDLVERKKRDRQSLVDQLITAGAVFKGGSCNCPWHDDKHPSAGIFVDDNGVWRFKCQTCGVSGDFWDIQARNKGRDVADVLRDARSQSPRPPKSVTSAKVYGSIEDLKSACPGTVEAVYTYSNPQTQKPEMIVIRCSTAEGKTFRQCRPCNGGFEMKAPEKPWPLYNRRRVIDSGTVVVVEGEKCVHALHEFGIVATTSPGGAGKAQYADWSILAGKNVILWPDNDTPGRKHISDIVSILEKIEPAVRISLIEPSELDLSEKEDAADYILQLKTVGLDVASELNRVLQNAKPKCIASKVSDRIEAIIEGKLESVPLPWRELSNLANAVIPGTVTLLCGSPGASKSFMLIQALCWWLEKGIKACVYELEEDREFHLMRALAQHSGTADITRMDWIKENPKQAREIFDCNKDFIEQLGRCMWASPENQITLPQLATWCDDRAKAGYRVICIDPVTAAAQSAKPWIDDNVFLQSIKKTATEAGCSFVLVTHPSKTLSQPDMASLAGSAAYSRFAQTILWLYSHQYKDNKVKTACGTIEENHNRTLHIIKARNGKGHGSSIACEFDSSRLILDELGLVVKKKGN